MPSKPIAPRTRLGCGFLCVSAILTCVLLAINGLIVMNLVNAVVPALPPEWREPRIAQAAVFLGPLLLLLIEWWVCDVAIDWLRPAAALQSRDQWSRSGGKSDR